MRGHFLENTAWGKTCVVFSHRKIIHAAHAEDRSYMMQYLIMCRSLTWAQRSAALLERNGITAAVVKAPQGLRTSGCGYAISLYRHFEEARNLLVKNNMINGKIFRRMENGEYQAIG